MILWPQLESMLSVRVSGDQQVVARDWSTFAHGSFNAQSNKFKIYAESKRI